MVEKYPILPIEIRLETARCVLRYPAEEDIDQVYTALSSSAFPKQLPLGQIRSREGVINWITNCQRRWRKGVSYTWTIEQRSDPHVLGQVTMARMDEPGTWSLAFWIDPQFWGQGHVTEAASRLISYWFQVMGALKIWAAAGLWNTASLRVLEKLGMRYVKDNPKGYEIEKEYISTQEFEITLSMWQGN